MNIETQKILGLGLTLSPAERVELARELMRSAAAENSAFAGELGERVSSSAYGKFGDQESSGSILALGPDEAVLRAAFTLEYWQDDEWYVGRLREVPGVFSQGETLADLEDNIRDAYGLVVSDLTSTAPGGEARRKRIEVEV